MDTETYARICQLEDHLAGLGIDLPDDYEPINRNAGNWRELLESERQHKTRYDKLIAERKDGERKLGHGRSENYYRGQLNAVGGGR